MSLIKYNVHSGSWGLMLDHYYSKGFIFLLESVPILDIEASKKTLEKDNFIFSDARYSYIGENPICVVIIDKNHKTLTVLAKTHKDIDLFTQNYKSLFIDARATSIDYYYFEDGRVESIQMLLKSNEIATIYPELYAEISIDILAEEFTRSKSSILLLSGPPGCGKTTFLKYLIKSKFADKAQDKLNYEENMSVAYIKSKEVMLSSSFWSQISTRQYNLMIFDDLDFSLAPRKEADTSADATFISNLLSYSDGLFNQKSKIVITTNQLTDKMDSALIRPGRCFDFLTLNPMKYDDALVFWENTLKMDKDKFASIYAGLETVSQASLMDSYERIQGGKLERGYIKGEHKSYSLEDKISKMGVASDSKKFGFGV